MSENILKEISFLHLKEIFESHSPSWCMDSKFITKPEIFESKNLQSKDQNGCRLTVSFANSSWQLFTVNKNDLV